MKELFELTQQSHDYAWLVKRWRAAAKEQNLIMKSIAMVDGQKIYMIKSRNWQDGGVYISAGAHGDEVAGGEGVLHWVGQRTKQQKKVPLMIFPCLNPWGLQANVRMDSTGLDLNRAWNVTENAGICAIKENVEGHKFAASLHLHEDYDAQGIYLYEVKGRVTQRAWGDELMQEAGKIIPPDRRAWIEGRKAKNGVIRARFTQSVIEMAPEAIYLYEKFAERSFTFETPSEFSLDARIRAQVAFLNSAVEKVLGNNT